MPLITKYILNSIVSDLYDVEITDNVYRGDYVERIIMIALGNGFSLNSGDWSGFDIKGPDGLKIEVKQSAARQRWSKDNKFNKGSFDIAPRKEDWSEGSKKRSEWFGRRADIYILAWHGVTDESCDHRDPDQWQFLVVPSSELPRDQKTIALSVVEKKWASVSFENLRSKVLETVARVRR